MSSLMHTEARKLTPSQQECLDEQVPAMRRALMQTEGGYLDFALRLTVVYERDAYAPWGQIDDFAEATFEMGRSRTYQLLKYGQFVRAWRAQSTAVDWTPTEGMFRRIGETLEQVSEQVRAFQRVKQIAHDAGRKEPVTADVEEVVPTTKKQKKKSGEKLKPGQTMHTSLHKLEQAESSMHAALDDIAKTLSAVAVEKHRPGFVSWIAEFWAELGGHDA